jgi:hypothetical protein
MKFKIKVPLWNLPVVVLIGNVDKIIEKYNVNIVPPAIAATWHDSGTTYIALDKEDPMDHLVHESAHAAFQIMHCLGIPKKHSTEEVFTYTQEAIVKKVQKKYKKWITKNLKKN